MIDEKEMRSEETVDDSNQDYITAIKELKQNSVDKAKYEEVLADRKRLLDTVVNGQLYEQEETKEQVDVNALRKEIFSGDLNNLEYIEKSLQLRDALMEMGETDPFLPYGKQILPTQEDIECANRVASVLKECVEYAEGDSAVFTNELQRRTLDVRIR